MIVYLIYYYFLVQYFLFYLAGIYIQCINNNGGFLQNYVVHLFDYWLTYLEWL